MSNKLLILAIGLTIGLVIGTVFAPAPATSQGRSQPISIAGTNLAPIVLYDNGEVWELTYAGWQFLCDASYPGASATQRASWGRIKDDFAGE